MNIEVEIKVKVENLEEIREKVSAIGKLQKSIRQIDEYYVPVHRDFMIQKPEPVEWLRIRINPDKKVFEYTRTINMKETGDYDYAEEYETEILSEEELRKILGFLDFKKVAIVDKKREYWQCGNIEVALDQVANLGDFIEAEAKGNFKEHLEAKEACVKFLSNLGIENLAERHIKKGYAQLVLMNQEK